VGRLLADLIAEFEFRSVTAGILREHGDDPHAVHDQLLKEGAFVPTDSLEARGRVPPDKQALYERACAIAEARGMWFLRDVDVHMAAVELSVSTLPPAEQDAAHQQYQQKVQVVIDQLDAGGCCAIFSFPGPRPWGASAAPLLGLRPLPDQDVILAPWPTKDDVPRLVEELNVENEAQRWWALEYLSRLGQAATPAVDTVAQRLVDDVPDIRCQAAHTLARLGPVASPAGDALADALDDRTKDLAPLVLAALGGIGAAARPAAPKLTAMLQQTELSARQHADIVSALSRIAPNTPEARQAILAAMDEPDPLARLSAMRSLATCDPLPPEALPKLIDALREDDRDIQGWAAETLILYGPAAKEALPALVEVLRSPTADDERSNAYRRWRAAEAIGEIGPEAAEAVPALMDAMSDDDDAVCAYATIALGKIGAAAKDAIPQMVEKLDDPDIRHGHLMQALGQMSPLAEAAVPALLRLLTTGKTYDRTQSAWALARIAPTPAVAAALAEASRNDENAYVRLHAAVALTIIGPDIVEDMLQITQPVIEEALGQDEDEFRVSAAYGLVRLGRVDEGLDILIQVLTEGAAKEMTHGAEAAAGTLGALGSIAEPAEEALLAAARHREQRLRQEARCALNRIRGADD